jgi:predicted AAA+ superfamily ATPase
MTHPRDRIALKRLKKKLKFSRVVTIQGARQTGKSFLASRLFHGGVYTTLDKKEIKDAAEKRPGTFLLDLQAKANNKTIVIDEAQKVPALFDEIKSVVDVRNRPGDFLLLGSTEFSLENDIKESLTGRISRTRLYPLLISETLKTTNHSNIDRFWKEKNKISRTDLLQFLRNGGFPAIFSIRSDIERSDRLKEWVDLTCDRDIHQIKKMKGLSSETGQRIIALLPFLENPCASELSKSLAVPLKKIQKHLDALEQIFALHCFRPYPGSTGKPQYFLIDPSLVSYNQENFSQALAVAIRTEFLAKIYYQEYLGVRRLSFNRNTKGSCIQLIIEKNARELIALKWSDSETFDQRELNLLTSFRQKMQLQGKKVQCVFACGVTSTQVIDEVYVLPWEYLF